MHISKAAREGSKFYRRPMVFELVLVGLPLTDTHTHCRRTSLAVNRHTSPLTPRRNRPPPVIMSATTSLGLC